MARPRTPHLDEPTKRPFAAFDIDGTVLRWQLYHAVNDALVKQGIIERRQFGKAREARMNWKRRAGEDSFRDYENELVKVFDATIAGLPVAKFEQAVDAVFDEYKEQVYTYTRDLIKKLRTKNYLLFAISGSPVRLVQKFADYYGFDDYAGTVYPTKDASFTGVKQLSLGKKHELLKQLVEKHGAGYQKSLAIGDSEGDIKMLAMADQPVAFNPTKELFQHAKKASWKVVLERKNMIYELEPKDGSYILASSDKR